MPKHRTTLAEMLRLAEAERTLWPSISAAIPAWHPRLEDPPEGDPPADPPADPPEDPPAADTATVREMRKWEARSKANIKRAEAAEAKLKERETADQTEHEKAVAAARAEGEKTASEKADKERRADRLEASTLRLAAKGIKVTVTEDGEEKVRTLRFADPDDAHANIERLIRRGDLDEEDIYDDQGKIRNDGLTTALTDLLADKPHLAASDSNGQQQGTPAAKVAGSADGGKGASGASKGGNAGFADLTVEQQYERIRQKQ